MYKFKKDKMKVHCIVWSEKGSLEDNTIEQIENVSSLPFIFHHASLMPDAHFGYGCPIGTVVALENVVIPNLVGVDIGCGMIAVKTKFKYNEDVSIDDLKKIMGEIRKAIPVGFNHQKKAQDEKLMPGKARPSYLPIVSQQWNSALSQLGTLGGGNHFIEIQKDEEDFIWIMIHSGSRNIGHKVASYYNKIAKELNKKWQSTVPPSHDLAFLPLDSEEAEDYIGEMNYCVEFALANRKLMMDRVQDIFIGVLAEDKLLASHPKFQFEDMINIAHNYAQMDNHFGENVMVHRKGATSAREGEIGIIPGSQGTSSYIVKGSGNVDSFKSCSHGAGRRMGRKDAQRTLKLEDEKKRLEDMGVVHSIRHVKDLDEAPGAYKDIDMVMDNQKDLIEIVTKLTPLAVIKG